MQYLLHHFEVCQNKYTILLQKSNFFASNFIFFQNVLTDEHQRQSYPQYIPKLNVSIL